MAKNFNPKSTDVVGKIMFEFNSRKKNNGDCAETSGICMFIAEKMGLTVEFVQDTVDLNRYEKELPEEQGMPEEPEDEE